MENNSMTDLERWKTLLTETKIPYLVINGSYEEEGTEAPCCILLVGWYMGSEPMPVPEYEKLFATYSAALNIVFHEDGSFMFFATFGRESEIPQSLW